MEMEMEMEMETGDGIMEAKPRAENVCVLVLGLVGPGREGGQWTRRWQRLLRKRSGLVYFWSRLPWHCPREKGGQGQAQRLRPFGLLNPGTNFTGSFWSFVLKSKFGSSCHC